MLFRPSVDGGRRTESTFAGKGADALSRGGFNFLRWTLAEGKLAQAFCHCNGNNGDLSFPTARGCTDCAHFVQALLLRRTGQCTRWFPADYGALSIKPTACRMTIPCRYFRDRHFALQRS